MRKLLALFGITCLFGAGARATGKSRRVGVTPTERRMFVLAINSVRGRVMPMAADMAFIVWCPYLEMAAQRWAETCRSDTKTPSYAKNDTDVHILMAHHAMTSSYSIDATLKAWHAQGKHFDHAAGSCWRNSSCSHYVALVSATAETVGCGIARWGQTTVILVIITTMTVIK